MEGSQGPQPPRTSALPHLYGLLRKELAHIIVFSIKGFKETARDGAEMRRLIAAHMAVIAAGIERSLPAR